MVGTARSQIVRISPSTTKPAAENATAFPTAIVVRRARTIHFYCLLSSLFVTFICASH